MGFFPPRFLSLFSLRAQKSHHTPMLMFCSSRPAERQLVVENPAMWSRFDAGALSPVNKQR